ncbi:MAG: hypothetical protein HC817_13635 [Saprospiraceae bacterium]|nr:hypothetical protein [Saprospiraceae bacterium]
MTNNLVFAPYTVRYYNPDSTKAYAFTNGLMSQTAEKNIDDFCNVVSVKALVRECDITDIQFRTGWLCDIPTATNWNPDTYAPCADSTLAASVQTEDPLLMHSLSIKIYLQPLFAILRHSKLSLKMRIWVVYTM